MPLLTTLLGAVLGAVLGRGFDGAISGGFIGLIVGLVLNSWRKNRRDEQKLAAGPATGAGDDCRAAHGTAPRRPSRA